MPRQLPRLRSTAAAVIAAATLLVGLPLAATASVAAGTADPTFGIGGVSRHHFAVTEDSRAVVALVDGSVAMAGLIRNSTTGADQIAVTHVTDVGDSWGSLTMGCGYPGEGAMAMAAAPASGLIVAGYSRTYGYPDTSFCIGRVNAATGVVDANFGSSGTTRTSFPGHAVMPRALAVDASGGILVIGDDADSPPAGQDARVFASRYLANGTLDTGFGSGGLAMVDLGGGYNGAGGVVATADGFVLAGTDSTSKSVVLTRLTSTGAVDTTFGTAGRTRMTTSPDAVQANGIVQDSTGGLVVSLYAKYSDFGAIRFTSAGARDLSYGTGGGTLVNFGATPSDNPNDSPSGIVMDAAGRIVIGGTSSYGGGSSWVLTRLLANGLIDSSFGGGGRVRTPIAMYDYANALAIDGQDRLLQTGTVSANDGTGADVAVARFIGGGAAPSADLAAHIQARAASVDQGATATYDIGAENLGPSAASNVVVHFAIPSGTSLGATTTTCTYASGAQDVACPLGDLASGASGQAFVTINVPTSQGPTLTAAVSVGSGTPDPEPNNDSDAPTVSVADVTPPTAQITAPAAGAMYQLGAAVTADFSCADDRGIGSCVESGPVDTSSVGSHQFSVQATDTNGNSSSSSVTYSVVSTTTANVPDGGTFNTPTPVDASTPVGTTITLPSGVAGDVTVTESGDVTQPAPAAYSLLGQQLSIEAPVATWDAPLTMTFALDASLLGGQGVGDIAILRNGVPLADCLGAATAIAPTPDALEGSPCVSARVLDSATGDATFTVLTPHASTWNFAVRTDTDGPAISIVRPADGATYVLGQNVSASYTCSDETGGSGVDTCTGPVPSGGTINTGSVGTKPFTVTGTDNAGNSTSSTSTYNVVYAFRGFLSPVVNQPALNAVVAGKGVPLRFSLAGNRGTSVVTSVASVPVTCPSQARPTKITSTVVGDGTLRYTASNDQYEYRWGTQRAWQKTCRSVSMTLNDGTTHSALFLFN